jgi:hypothetical protein
VQTCSYCGRPSNKAALFCANCGQSMRVTTPTKDDNYFLALERHTHRQRVKRIHREGSNESLELYSKVIIILAFLHGLTFLLPNTTNIANGNTGTFLVVIALLAAIIKSIHDQRLGISRLRSYSETIVIGIFVYGIVVGIFWYFGNLTHDPNAFKNMFKLPTPTLKTK